jgi:hypothetical protein
MTVMRPIEKQLKTMLALFLICLMFSSCEGDREVHLRLSNEQRAFLTMLPKGKEVRFDEGGAITRAVVGDLQLHESVYEPRVGMFSQSVKNYTEYGNVNYDLLDNGVGVKVSVYATAGRGVEIGTYDMQQLSGNRYSLDFDKIVRSKTINGITYKNVFLAIDSYDHDTLYWSSTKGILGWKEANKEYTAYRVF